jgi:hypothetical protein
VKNTYLTGPDYWNDGTSIIANMEDEAKVPDESV